MTNPSHALPDLLRNWEPIATRLRQSPRVAIFFDFDGTLAPIAAHPDQVRLPPGTRHSLERLANLSRVSVTVISGRRRGDICHHIAVRKLRYWGLYGWERWNRMAIPRATEIALQRSSTLLKKNLSVFRGVWVEDKGKSLSIHFLGVSPSVSLKARRRVSLLLRPFLDHLHVFRNQRDIEIAPVFVSDKGAAVRECLRGKEFRNALPMYFGDDFSDEPAFDAVRKGVGVFVGRQRRTRARFRLRGPGDVARALIRLEATLS